MKLNLASGLHPTNMPGWVNVDLPWHGVTGADVYADAYQLPFPHTTFSAAYLGHFLEHVELDALPALGVELRRVLQPGAPVMTVGPDIDRAVATGQPAWLLDAITDLNGGVGGHKWVATESLTIEACRRLGLDRIRPVDVATVTAPEYPNPTCAAWQCAVAAAAPQKVEVHQSVMEWAATKIADLGLAGRSTLEVGSFNVNGSVRCFFSGCYVGVDMRPGPGVDVVAPAAELPYPDDRFAVVVSTEMLEHDPTFWLSIPEMVRVLQPGGFLLLTARGNGFLPHDYPNDYWRFNVDSLRFLAESAGLEVLEVIPDTDPHSPGVFLAAQLTSF